MISDLTVVNLNIMENNYSNNICLDQCFINCVPQNSRPTENITYFIIYLHIM